MAGRLLFRYFYGLSQEKREWVNLAEVRAGQLPAPGAVDFQAVPLCLQKNAKGGENGTQLASLRQAPHFLQRIFLRAKRKPAPGIQARLCPEIHRRWELTKLKARGYSLNSGSKLL